MRIYLDHNAGAPLRLQARDAIERLLDDGFGNPASVHHGGQRARAVLEEARAKVASAIGASSRQLVFTSGGTESNNLAIFGAVRTSEGRRRIITSAIEHSSILEPLKRLEGGGFEIVRIAPDAEGCIASGDVIEALDRRTALVSIGLANSEVGTVQDLAPLSAPLAQAGALFHIDAAQAIGKIPFRVDELGCDLMTVSGHKLGAPAGVGALYVRAGADCSPQILGGGQEGGLRAGTPNLLGAAALGAAAEAAARNMGAEAARVSAIADRLIARLEASIPGLRFNGRAPGSTNRLKNTINLTFPGVLGESMLIALDLEGVEVSMGSACAAGAVEPSHVLLAMGRTAAQARSSLRISLGWSTTISEIEAAAEIIAKVWRRVADAEPLASEAAR